MVYRKQYGTPLARTTVAVEADTRDALVALRDRLGFSSVDDAIRLLLVDYDCREAGQGDSRRSGVTWLI